MRSRWILRSVAVAVLMLTLPVVAVPRPRASRAWRSRATTSRITRGIFTYTSQVSNVGNLIYGELGNLRPPPALRSTGASAPCSATFGTAVSAPGASTCGSSPRTSAGRRFTPVRRPETLGIDPNFNTNESFDLMWGRKFGTTSFGLRLNRSFVKFDGTWATSRRFGPLTDLEFDVTARARARQPQPGPERLRRRRRPGLRDEPEHQRRDRAPVADPHLRASPTRPASTNEEDGTDTYLVAAARCGSGSRTSSSCRCSSSTPSTSRRGRSVGGAATAPTTA